LIAIEVILLAVGGVCLAQERPDNADEQDTFYMTYWYTEPEGWHWYKDDFLLEEPEPEEEAPEEEKGQDLQVWVVPEYGKPPEELTPEQFAAVVSRLPVKELKRLTAVLLDRSLEPGATFEDVKKYMILHREVMTRANLFAMAWRDILMVDPYFDWPRTMLPMTALGQDVWAVVKQQQDLQMISRATLRCQLVFFYEKGDPFSKAQAQIMDRLVEKHGFKVIRVERSEAESKGKPAPSYPSVYLVLPKEGSGLRIASGIVPVSEMERRIIRGYELLMKAEALGAQKRKKKDAEVGTP